MAALTILVLAGCVTAPAPPSAPEPVGAPDAVAAPDANEAPQVTTRSFLIRGPRFPIGQAANVRVCVDASGTIVSVELAGSSGESGFDEFAMTWARHADVQNWAPKNARQLSCGNVRVEIGRGTHPGLGTSVDNALG